MKGILNILAIAGQASKGESHGKATTVGEGIFVLSLDPVKQVSSVFTITLHFPVPPSGCDGVTTSAEGLTQGLSRTSLLTLRFSTGLALAAGFRPEVCPTFELPKWGEGVAGSSQPKGKFSF